MERENEPLLTGETASVQHQTDAISPVQPQTDKVPSVIHPATPVPRTRRITRFIDDIRPSPGSNIMRIYGISDCVIAVAFTLFVVNIQLPPGGLSESQLQSFITRNILSG